MVTDPLLREVDEALRHDQMIARWRYYRRPVITAAAIIVLFTLGMTQWHNYQEKKAGELMEEFSAGQSLFAQGKFSEAAATFAAIAKRSTGHEISDLTHLWQARALLGADKKADAISILSALADHPQSKQLLWRDLACLRLAALDESKAGCLDAPAPSPLAAQRMLTRAAILWNANHLAESQHLLESLIDNPETPASVRSNAQHYLSVVQPGKSSAVKKV